ncbi:MAG: rRNA maturation RNase YbeY [Bacteroidota bacterium]
MTLNKINFFAQNVSQPVKKKKLIRAWLLLLLQKEVESLSSVEINLIFCDDEYLYQLNTKYLKHTTLTDIITFDYSEDNHLKADVFISTERVKENAKLFSQTFTDEISRVMAHGLLHVCGYKDKTAKAKAIMTEKENFYLDLLNDFTNQSNA